MTETETFHLKQEWEDDITKEDEEKIKIGIKRKCMNCHPVNCDCKDAQTYWGF